ncbi:MAG: hypothetical protein F4Y49_14200 [Dehalococcoidia bacterium]|nr:hypothetical protein [Dehalococcoidia bacterium]
MEQFAVLFSIDDALQILDDSPLQPDAPGQTTFVQISNRVPISHLAIERGLKFLIKKHGGIYGEHHGLNKHLRKLRELDPNAVAFLEKTFDDTSAFYGLNPNYRGLGHIRTLKSYLDTVGTKKAFNSMRYWELDPEQEESLFRQIWPAIHRELLTAVRKLIVSNGSEGETITGRVEQTIHNALFPTDQLGYRPGSDHETTVKCYMDWVLNHASRREALTQAFQRDFVIGDEFMNKIVRQAYQSLTQSPDPAIRYLVSSIDVLPPQPRDLIPLIEWSDLQEEQPGRVLTPGGTTLGLIQRTPDGIWHILPFRTGTSGKLVRARSQTDARSYLAQLLSVPCILKVNDEQRTIRLVGEPSCRFMRNYSRMRDSADSHDSVPWTHKLNSWEQAHGIKPDDQISVEVPDSDEPHFVHVIEGQVTLTNGTELFVEGREILDVVASS